MATRGIENATISTGHRLANGSRFESHAVLIKDSRILARKETALRADADSVIDAGGGVVTAGFGNGHAHQIRGGLEAQFAPVGLGTNPQEIARLVGELAKAHSEVEWDRVEGFDHTTTPDGIFFAARLDAEVPDRSVVLRATASTTSAFGWRLTRLSMQPQSTHPRTAAG